MYREKVYAVETEVRKREFLTSFTLNNIDASLFNRSWRQNLPNKLSIKLLIIIYRSQMNIAYLTYNYSEYLISCDWNYILKRLI